MAKLRRSQYKNPARHYNWEAIQKVIEQYHPDAQSLVEEIKLNNTSDWRIGSCKMGTYPPTIDLLMYLMPPANRRQATIIGDISEPERIKSPTAEQLEVAGVTMSRIVNLCANDLRVKVWRQEGYLFYEFKVKDYNKYLR